MLFDVLALKNFKKANSGLRQGWPSAGGCGGAEMCPRQTGGGCVWALPQPEQRKGLKQGWQGHYDLQ